MFFCAMHEGMHYAYALLGLGFAILLAALILLNPGFTPESDTDTINGDEMHRSQ